MADIENKILEILPSLISLRRQLHRRPELAFHETETAKRIIEELQQIPGMSIESEIAKTGIAALLGKEKSGPCIALRCELDALPIYEESGVEYESEIPGKMHACGHDGHMSALVGAAKVLAEYEDSFSGPVKFIFQPAEEHGAGAMHMCKAGVLNNPKVDTILAFHCTPRLPLGSIGVAESAIMASSDSVKITVSGKGTHAAAPHAGCDPVLAASQIVVSLQAIAARSTNPTDSLVVSISKFHAGEEISPDRAPNVIPEKTELEGTIRALCPKVRAAAKQSIVQIAENTAAAFGAEAKVEFREGYPALVNDKEARDLVLRAAKQFISPDSINYPVSPMLVSEDFSYYTNEAKAAMWLLGIRPDTAEYPFLHNPHFDFVDDALFQGVRMHCECVRAFFA